MQANKFKTTTSSVIPEKLLQEIQDYAVHYCMENYRPGEEHEANFDFGPLKANFCVFESNPNVVIINVVANDDTNDIDILFDYGVRISFDNAMSNLLGFYKQKNESDIGFAKWTKSITLVIKNNEKV